MCLDDKLLCPGCETKTEPTAEEINKALVCAESETTCMHCGLIFRFYAGQRMMYEVLS